MNGADLGLDWGTLWAVWLGCLVWGIGFNLLTAWAERRGYMKGYTSLFVAAGVAVTVVLTAVISLAFALVTAVAFVASGTPMIVGSIWRHVREREGQLEMLRDEARGPTPGLPTPGPSLKGGGMGGGCGDSE